MFRLVVVAAVLACASASGIGHHHWESPVVATSYASHPVTHVEKHVIPGRTWTEVQPQVAVVEQPYVAKVGDQVHNVPTGVSYQSSSVVHSKNVVSPIYAHGVQKQVVQAEPIVKTYQEPALVKTVATQQHVAYAHSAPVAYAAPALSYAAHTPHLSYASHAPVVSYAAHAPVVAKTIAAPIIAKTIAAPVAYAAHGYAGHGYAGHGYAAHGYAGHGYAHDAAWAAPVVSKTVWGNTATPYHYGLGAKAVVASPWSYGYGVKSALASPWNAHQAW